MNFRGLLRGATRTADGGYSLFVSREWANGRTTFGGWLCAVAYNAARLLGEEGGQGQGQGESEGGSPSEALPPLRSAMISFIGPVWDAFEVQPRILRQGRNATWIAVDIVKDGAVALAGTFLFMRPLDSKVALENLPMPAVSARPGDLPRAFAGEGVSGFVNRFEVFPADHEPPEAPVHAQWVRVIDRGEMDRQSELMLIGDFCPPGFYRLMPAMAPVCSMTWQVNLLGDLSESPDGFWLIRTESHHTEAGANSQLMQVWDSAGRAVVAGQQSTALFI